VRIGPSGAGQLAKMVNQICIAGLVQGLSEAVLFAERSGVDLERVFDAIGQGAARSWQMEHRWRTMHAGRFDFGFAVDWMRKDLGIVREEARRLGVELPVTEEIDTFYAEIQAMGGGRWDTSSLVERLRRVERLRSSDTEP
jgi:3-hydroxyisobutyrate dehydrogenase-like beta-hydroxyacid dehydrogenase